MKHLALLIFISVIVTVFSSIEAKNSENNSWESFEQGVVISKAPQALPLRERVPVVNDMVKYRLDNLLPQLMDEANVDMWLVINREYGEDKLFYTLVPEPTFAARRTTLLVFARTDKGVERFSVSRYPIGDFYPTRWQGGTAQQQWQRLAETIAEYDPKNIAINKSQSWAVADGLSVGMQQTLLGYLPEKYQQRLVSSEQLVVRWFETRTEPELKQYPDIVKIARGVIAEAFSNKVIKPGVTTDQDVAWYIRQRFEALDVQPWFQPYVTVQRKGDKNNHDAPFFGKSNRTIEAGDIIHTDVGICYLKLCTDTQEMGYVARKGETSVPKGLLKAMAKGNQWQDILTNNFVTGKTGNEILKATQNDAKKAELFSSTYTHPLGFVGHAVGPTIGMWDNQGETPIYGDWKLFPNTAYAIEGNIKTHFDEWDDQLIQVMLEQSAYFDGEKVIYLAGRQTQWHFIESK